MNNIWSIIKDLAIIGMLLVAFVSSYVGQWDKGAFFMAMACYAILVREKL